MSAYRSAPKGAPPLTVAVLCSACGNRSERLLPGGIYACASCGTEQPVAQDNELPKTAALCVVRHTPAGYDELVAFAQSLGLSGGAMAITISCAGIEVDVSLDINSGVVCRMDLFATSPGLPTMLLRRENEADVRAKERRVAREVQTGDVEFDRAVFIESDAADSDVLAPLASPTVRAAVLRLLADFDRIGVSPTRVKVTATVSKEIFEAQRLTEQLIALRVIAGAPRAVVPAEGRPSRRPALLGTTIVGGVAALALAVVGGYFYEPLSPAPIVIGLAVGLVIAFAAWPLLTMALRGRSTSARAVVWARLISLGTFPLLSLGALLVANGALDRSPARRHELIGYAVEISDEGGTIVRTRGQEPSVGDRSYSFDDPKQRLKLPAKVTVMWHDGAFGFAWEESRVACHTETGDQIE